MSERGSSGRGRSKRPSVACEIEEDIRRYEAIRLSNYDPPALFDEQDG